MTIQGHTDLPQVPSDSLSISRHLTIGMPLLTPLTGLRHWAAPGFVLTVLGVCAVQLQDVIREDEWIIPGIVICLSGLVLLPAMRKALRRRTHEVFADHLMVLSIAFTVYFVVGALLVPFGPPDQADIVLAYYPINAVEAMRVTGVNDIGLGLALFFGSLVRGDFVSKLGLRAIGLGRSLASESVIAVFLLIGAISTLYVLPFDIGLRTGVVSGSLRSLSQLLLVAILLSAAHSGRGSNWLLSAAITLTIVQAVSGLLQLNKSVVLLPIVALLGGLAWRHGIRRVIVPGFAGLLLFFVLIASPVSTARNIFGVGSRVDLGERISLLSGAIMRSGEVPAYHVSTTWARFCYLTVQGAALNLYDQGSPEGSFHLLGWSLVPRVLFPMKPIMSNSGADFYYQLTGQVGSASGHGIFVNGYYNLGWWGVIFVGITAGCMLGTTSVFAARVYETRATLWMPFALLGSYMAFRIDGDFLTDYWGPFVLFAYALVAGAALMESSRISGSAKRLA